MSHKLYKQLLCSLAAPLIFSLIFCGCSHENGKASPAEKTSEQAVAETDYNLNPEDLKLSSQEYNMILDSNTPVTFNGLGKIIGDEDTHVTALLNVLTGDTAFYTVYNKTFTKKEDGDYETSCSSRLYDVSGRLLIDWDEVVYSDGFGDWVVAQKYIDMNSSDLSDIDTKLINVKTKEAIPGISSVESLDNYIMGDSFDGDFLCTLDSDGKILYDFSTLKKTLGKDITFCRYQNYIVANKTGKKSNNYYFYDPKGRYLGSITDESDAYIYSYSIQSPYIMVGSSIYNPSLGQGGKLNPVSTYKGQDILYYDSSVTIHGKTLADDSTELMEVALYDIKSGRKLSKTYNSIYRENNDEAINFYSDEESASFYGLSGSHIDKIGRDGQVLAQIDIENLSGISVYRDAILCRSDDWSKEFLLDLDLNIITASQNYISFYPVSEDTKSSKNNLWAAQYYLDPDQTQVRYDLITSDGKVILDSLSAIESIKNSKITILRGQSFGLIDLSGNWLTKFSKLNLSTMD